MREVTIPISKVMFDSSRVDDGCYIPMRDSIKTEGQKHPITVQRSGRDRFILIDGVQRINALMKLKHDTVQAYIIKE